MPNLLRNILPWSGSALPKFSAYLIIYNDWDFLDISLRSLAPFVDDLVVVDGAYEWMTPFYRGLGKDLDRSEPPVYDAIKASGIPFRVLAGVWPSQIEKRIAGYDACRNRHICRIDSDEILFFNERELGRFFSRGAVANVDMPTYVAPGWVVASHKKYAAQGFLFDRERVPAAMHLHYLWSSVWLNRKNVPEETPFRPYSRSVGFAAHLTDWRSPEHAARRAEYYNLHWMYTKRTSWLAELNGENFSDLTKFFDRISPATFHEIMLSSKIAPQHLRNTDRAVPTPLNPSQEVTFADRYQLRNRQLVMLNEKMASEGLCYRKGSPITVDVTDSARALPVTSGDSINFEFSSDVSQPAAELYEVRSDTQCGTTRSLRCRTSGRRVEVHLPPPDASSNQLLRRQVELRVRNSCENGVGRFQIRI
jgi:hypothetical protein